MRLLSLQETSKRLGGISLALLRKAIADGRLPAVRVGRRVLLDEEYIEQRCAQGQLFRAPRQFSANRE
jgi:excisionase family DNA binding protein